MVVLFALAAQARALPRAPFDPMDPNQPFGAELSFLSPDPIPPDGAIGLKFKLLGDPTGRQVQPIVQLSRPDPNDVSVTTTFAGTLREVAKDYWAWTADAPLELGSYTFSAAHIEVGTITMSIEVVERVAIEPPGVSIEQTSSSIAWTFVVTEYAACRFQEGTVVVEGPAFPIRHAGRLLLQTRLALESEQRTIHQFLYRTFTGPFDFSPFRAANELLDAGPLNPRVGEHCAQVEALSLATGDVFAYPEIEVCASYAGGEDLREERLIVSSEELSRYNCQLPPEGYEKEWCEDNEQCISISRTPELIDVNNCRGYFDSCPDAQRPDAGTDAGTSDAGVGMTTVPDAGMRDAGVRSNEDPLRGDAGEDDGASSSGCVAAHARTNVASHWLASFIVVASALLVRRRRGR